MLSIHTTDGDKVRNKPTVALIVFVWVRASLHVGCCVVPYSVLSMFSVFVGVFAEPASVLQNPADCVYTSTGIPTWSLTYLSLSSSCYITISRLSLSCLIYPISISLSIICNYPLLSLFSVFTKDEYSLTHCIVCQTVFTQQQGEQGENGSSSPHVSPGENGVDDVNQDIDTVRPHHVPPCTAHFYFDWWWQMSVLCWHTYLWFLMVDLRCALSDVKESTFTFQNSLSIWFCVEWIKTPPKINHGLVIWSDTQAYFPFHLNPSLPTDIQPL